MGFEPLVNQRLLPPTFPRYTRIVSREVAYEKLALLLSRLKTVTGISSCTSFESALVNNHLNKFSSNCIPFFVRSLESNFFPPPLSPGVPFKLQRPKSLRREPVVVEVGLSSARLQNFWSTTVQRRVEGSVQNFRCSANLDEQNVCSG
jgi:hypothetical protein